MTATETYAERFAICQSLIAQLQAALDAHQARQAQDPRNWGYAGDLAHYVEMLCDMLNTLPKADSLDAE